MVIFNKIKNRIDTKQVTTWYGKYERKISSSFLVGGFIIDWLTLSRVDSVWENVWVLGHIIMIGTFITLVHWLENIPEKEDNIKTIHFWFTNILQFFFGGILSVFLVFYFRSAELSTSWLFILILVVAFLGNESLKHHMERLVFQLSMFFLSLFCTLIYILPVVMHRIGGGTFLLSGFLSLLIMLGFLHLFVYYSGERFYQSSRIVAFSILGIYFVINLFYFANIIPPIPLSLKNSGVYHSIQKNEAGSYIGEFENYGWQAYFNIYTDFHASETNSVYAYSAVFSPTSLNLTIVHQWQYYNENTNDWVDYDRVSLPVIGGRDRGFRTFSMKNNLASGKWRVNVETEGGQVIGRLRFNVLTSIVLPKLETKILN